MHFTEGKDLEYERLMQQKPGFDRKPNKLVAPRGNGDAPAACIGMHRRKNAALQPAYIFPDSPRQGGSLPFIPSQRSM